MMRLKKCVSFFCVAMMSIIVIIVSSTRSSTSAAAAAAVFSSTHTEEKKSFEDFQEERRRKRGTCVMWLLFFCSLLFSRLSLARLCSSFRLLLVLLYSQNTHVDVDSTKDERRKKEAEEEEEEATTTTAKPFEGLSEEEQQSLQVPSHMRCDACRAISHRLVKETRKEERKHRKGKFSSSFNNNKKNKRLRTDQYEESFERTCKDEEYWGEYYGVAHGKDGHNYLNGPGLTELPKTLHKGKTMALETTTHRKGGFWSHRLRELCEQMVYGGEVLDEEEMYAILFENTPEPTSPTKEEEEIIINTDTMVFRDAMCEKTCKKFPSRRPSTKKEEDEGGWEPFDEDAFTQRKIEQKKKDEAYMRAHKMVEDLKMGRMDVSGGEL